MKSSLGIKIATPYFIGIVILTIYVFTKSGDTAIIPALIISFPWAFPFDVISASQQVYSVAINILLNSLILYLIGILLDKVSSK